MSEIGHRVETIRMTGPAGAFDAYLARPAAAPASAPAIVVLQEIFGVNADIRATCDELAARGYLAVAPDLYWRQQPGVSLTDGSEADWSQAMTLYKAFDIDGGIDDIAATIAAMRVLPGCSGRIGAVGYCLGGLLAFLTALRTDADAAVAFYGVGIDGYLAEVGPRVAPMLLQIAEEDQFVPKAAQASIRAALGARPDVEIHLYPGCRHAFARHDGIDFDPAAAALANARAWAFFDSRLR